jgi:hypothetical protein
MRQSHFKSFMNGIKNKENMPWYKKGKLVQNEPVTELQMSLRSENNPQLSFR